MKNTAPQPATIELVSQVIAEFDAQGIHRAATEVDAANAEWLHRLCEGERTRTELHEFAMDRVDPGECSLEAGGKRIDGLPMFDWTFDGDVSVRARLSLDAGHDVIRVVPVEVAGHGPSLLEARQQPALGIVAVVKGGDGVLLAPRNAEAFEHPFGPPVLQVAYGHEATLTELARAGSEATFTVSGSRSPATALNVLATVVGRDTALAPLGVLTPRSGWFNCASERGGGLAAWMHTLRILQSRPHQRTVHFAATTAHELGYLGAERLFGETRGLASNALFWVHLGANLGSAEPRATVVRSSNLELRAKGYGALASLPREHKVEQMEIGALAGEAEKLSKFGASFVSYVGRNALFHSPADRWPGAVNASDVALFAEGIASLVSEAAIPAE